MRGVASQECNPKVNRDPDLHTERRSYSGKSERLQTIGVSPTVACGEVKLAGGGRSAFHGGL